MQERQQHDNFLLTTYTSTKDIERLRDERLDQLDGQIKAANAYIDTLNAPPEDAAGTRPAFQTLQQEAGRAPHAR